VLDASKEVGLEISADRAMTYHQNARQNYNAVNPCPVQGLGSS
jgi:hypothetical protein